MKKDVRIKKALILVLTIICSSTLIVPGILTLLGII